MPIYTYKQIGAAIPADELDPERDATDQAAEFCSCMNDRTRAKYAELGVEFTPEGVVVRDAQALDDASLFAYRIHFATDWAVPDAQPQLMPFRKPDADAIAQGFPDANIDEEAQSYLNGDDDVDYGGSYLMTVFDAIKSIGV